MDGAIKKHGRVMAWSVLFVMVMIIIGLIGCNSVNDDGETSPTTPTGSAVELGNYAQQSGQSQVVTVNGATHQLNGVISGSVVAGGLYLEINEQSSVGSSAGTDQVMVSLTDVKLTFTGLPSGISSVTVKSGDTAVGEYAVSNGSVAIALSVAQWTQWFGPTHYAVVCVAVGSGTLSESMTAVSGRLPSDEVVTFGKGFGSATSGGTTCPTCPTSSAGTCNPNTLPTFADNGNGTVIDTHTGLIWLKDANCNGIQTWANAGSWAAGLADGSCGLNDGSTAGQWRLPTVTELQDLIDYSRSSPALPNGGAPFINVENYYYWASTVYNPDSARAWCVGMDYGGVYYSFNTSTYHGWAVR